MLARGIVLFLFTLCCVSIQAQDKTSQVKIFPPADQQKFSELIGLLEIDHYMTSEDGGIVAELEQKHIKRLKLRGYRHEILIDNMFEHVQKLNRKYEEDKAKGLLPVEPTGSRLAFEQTGKTINDIIATPAAFEVKTGFLGYYRFSEMEAAMDALVAAYPALAQKINLTPNASQRTVGNRNIWCIKISDNVTTDETNEPEVLFIGVQHAREAIGGASMIFFMQYLCENYNTDNKVKALVDNRQIYIIPCMNPDGWEHNYSLINGGNQGGWRKNRNGNGVDLNRNWGVDWGNCAGASSSCGSSNSSSDTYYGTSAFSEKETQAIRDFTYTRRFAAMIDQHAYGPYYSLPFGRPSLHTMDPLDEKFYTYIPAAMGTYNGMRAGNSPQSVNYEVAGGVKDWMLLGNIGTGTKGKVYGLTGEGGAGGGTGSQGSYASFWAPKTQIVNLCKGMVFQNIQLLLSAGTYIDLQDKSDMAIGSKTGAFQFEATRVGLGNDPVTISLIPIQNIQSAGSPHVIHPASLANYYDNYTGAVNYTLPSALANGQRIQFAWRIEAGGITWYDTITKFYHSTPSSMTMLTDNMNSGSVGDRWTVTGSWGYTSNGTGYGGTGRALSESPSGNYSGGITGTNSTARWTNTINLSSATAAYLTFWVKHRAENFRDKLQVQFSRNSTNGTNGDWTAIRGTTTIEEPGTIDGSTINGQPAMTGIRDLWTKVSYDLADFTGAGNNSVRFRFVFTSDPNTGTFAFRQDDGFYIDDLQLVYTTAAQVALPVEFTSFTGTLTSQQTVELEWQAIVDEHHRYFEVEKSTDGQAFTAIAKVTHPFSYTDHSPIEGNNYYRIKQYDADGRYSYSKTISVYLPPRQFSLQIFPNPSRDVINLKVKSPSPEKLTLQFADLSGKIVYTTSRVVSNGSTVPVDISHLPSQVYMLIVTNKSNAVLAKQKVIKTK